ncbi:MAG TPA: phosphotransferase [Acidimicrobiales bacterium]|nr:phosphotransferase [Acidimicrobiales bacterium]
MSWNARKALRATTPDDDGLARLGVDLGSPVIGVERLAGGIATSTHALRLADGSDVVVKRFVPVDDEPTAWHLEWERLHVAMATPVPTPAPVALDDEGRWFGVPAIAMARVPGVVQYPVDPAALGRTLAMIHTTVVPAPVPSVLHRPPYFDVVPSDLPWVFCHGDFHPGNVLVAPGDPATVTGVVDWSGCRFAPRGMDVGIARCDMAIEPGGDAPDVFLASYEEAAGVRVEHVSLWDAQGIGRVERWCHEWVDSWDELDVPVTEALMRERIRLFAARSARRIDGCHTPSS